MARVIVVINKLPKSTCALTASSQDVSNSSTYTFSSLSSGPADSSRLLLATVGITGSTNITVSSVAIGGISATSVAENTTVVGGTASAYCGLFAASVPTGTTATVVVNVSAGSAVRCAVDLFRAVNLRSTTKTHSDTSIAIPGALSVSAEVDGFTIAASCSVRSGGNTFSWSGMSEVSDNSVETNGQLSSALDNWSTAQSSLSVTATPSATPLNMVTVYGSFR
jgi:hypothetical protein